MVPEEKPTPKPPIPSPAQLRAKVAPKAPAVLPATPSVPPTGGEEALDPRLVSEAAAFGRVADDGTVYLVTKSGETVVGQYPDVPTDEALSLYIRRFLDIQANVDLFASRLAHLSAKDLDSSLKSLEDSLVDPAVVGDVDGLRARVQQLHTQAEERKDELAQERAAAKDQATREREAIVEKAEELAAADPHQVQWKQQSARLRELLDEWKTAQRTGVRIDRPVEDALWKRFSAARSTCDRQRRQFFAELDREHSQAREVKEQLVARAEALSNSTDWGPTTAVYRSLMDEWKQAGRASRQVDDELWARFRAAQDVFFQARQAQRAETDAEYQENLARKLDLLDKAEAILPVTDVKAAKVAFYDLLDSWDGIGHVPRENLREVEDRLQAVERAIRDADESERNQDRPGPALAEGFSSQLRHSITDLEAEIAEATKAGRSQKVADLEAKLDTQRTWLEQLES